MVLVDSPDGVLMAGAYRWAALEPYRKLYYNLAITAASVLMAVAIGGLEMLQLVATAGRQTPSGVPSAQSMTISGPSALP